MAEPLRISLAAAPGGGGGTQQEVAAGGGKQQQGTVSVRVCGDMVAGCAVSFWAIFNLQPNPCTLPAPCSCSRLRCPSTAYSRVPQDCCHHAWPTCTAAHSL